MAAMKKGANRKMNVIVLLEEPEIKFLDRKVDKSNSANEANKSRSALIRRLVRVAMANPEILEFKQA
jgi:hypothetical protein